MTKTIQNTLVIAILLIKIPMGFAQKEIDIPLNQRVVLNFVDHVVYANILSTNKEIKPDLDRYYFWYSANDIKRTRGGFDGKLLHGEYIEFYPDKSLKEKGEFRYGLKHGIWKTWYPSGEIASIVRWKKGRMHGDFRYFDETGDLKKVGCYKDDELHGPVRTYLSDGKFESCTYRNGDRKIKKKIFYKRWFSGKNGDKKSATIDKNGKTKIENSEKRNEIKEGKKARKFLFFGGKKGREKDKSPNEDGQPKNKTIEKEKTKEKERAQKNKS